ncbi:MAG TPA: ABC transporter substrate-binding protein [Burkholderiaceae bacterium]|nr:ABC transporter substrate-binding protein [Burkholderiaceae bacterium]
MTVELSLACQLTDRTRALSDGRVAIAGCRVNFIHAPAEEIFQRAFRRAEFDIAELSLGTHLLTTANGTSTYIGVPAFVSRSFRHSAIYVRASRVATAADLRGKQVGVPDFQQTAGIWVRGILADEYGVTARDVQWVTGGLEQPGRATRVPANVAAGIQVRGIEPDETLAGLLAEGRIDAVIAPRVPSCFGTDPDIVRLFPAYRAEEEAYFRKTGLFPLMHTIGIQRTLVERHPWLPMNVYQAFMRAKEIALEEMTITDTLRVSHPWIVPELDGLRALMGRDVWRYGVAENEHELGRLMAYARNDGLIDTDVPLDQLFASSTFDNFRF